jgi:hypothetical protein
VGGVIGTSQNGEYVYYTDEGGIVLWHNGETKRFGPGLGEATPSLASFFGGHQIQARVTPDGQYLVYAHEVHGECGWSGEFDCQEIYVYSAATNTVSCASCQQSGETPSFDAGTAVTGFHGPTEPNGVLAPVFPGNGKYVFFSTEQSLLPRDTNGVSDVYEYNTETGELSLLSSGTSKRGSWLLGTGEDGRDVFIDTEQQLVGWDNDSAYDVYDVRIGGGLPEPPAVHAPCTGEVCQGAATPAPSSAPLSSNLESAGNVKVHRHPCPPGTHAVKSHGKTRCAKSKHRKSHRHGKAHRRAARAYRRASK